MWTLCIDEFMVILPETDLSDVLLYCERVEKYYKVEFSLS